jgi:hypothetical protein
MFPRALDQARVERDPPGSRANFSWIMPLGNGYSRSQRNSNSSGLIQQTIAIPPKSFMILPLGLGQSDCRAQMPAAT